MSAAAFPAAAPVRVRALPGVWPPHSDAALLARALSRGGWAAGADVLDMFTGTGALALTAARLGARSVLAVDLSRRALASTRLNARRNGLRVRTQRSNLFSALGNASSDLILANPPYYPGSGRTRRRRGRAWDGGDQGRALIDELCRQVPARLTPGGRLLLVHATFNGETETVEALRAGGLEVSVVERLRGPFGEIGRRQVDAGDGEEETIVISAVRPRG
jgi:release factor glutamine methyltransferase